MSRGHALLDEAGRIGRTGRNGEKEDRGDARRAITGEPNNEQDSSAVDAAAGGISTDLATPL